MHKFLIDVQKGFITKDTKHILPKINPLLDLEIFKFIMASQFINEENSPYRKFLGWNEFSKEKKDDILLYEPVKIAANKIITKYGYTGLTEEAFVFLKLNDINEVFIAGIDTDCCVLATAIDLFENNIRPFVLKDCSASTGGDESHRAGIRVLERLIDKNSILVFKK